MLRKTWSALREIEQWRLLDRLVAHVHLHDGRGTISVDFAPALFDVVARGALQSRTMAWSNTSCPAWEPWISPWRNALKAFISSILA